MNVKKTSEILHGYRQDDAPSKEVEMVRYWFTNLADKGDWHSHQGEKEILEFDIEKRLLQNINGYERSSKSVGKMRLFKIARLKLI